MIFIIGIPPRIQGNTQRVRDLLGLICRHLNSMQSPLLNPRSPVFFGNRFNLHSAKRSYRKTVALATPLLHNFKFPKNLFFFKTFLDHDADEICHKLKRKDFIALFYDFV